MGANIRIVKGNHTVDQVATEDTVFSIERFIALGYGNYRNSAMNKVAKAIIAKMATSQNPEKTIDLIAASIVDNVGNALPKEPENIDRILYILQFALLRLLTHSLSEYKDLLAGGDSIREGNVIDFAKRTNREQLLAEKAEEINATTDRIFQNPDPSANPIKVAGDLLLMVYNKNKDIGIALADAVADRIAEHISGEKYNEFIDNGKFSNGLSDLLGVFSNIIEEQGDNGIEPND